MWIGFIHHNISDLLVLFEEIRSAHVFRVRIVRVNFVELNKMDEYWKKVFFDKIIFHAQEDYYTHLLK